MTTLDVKVYIKKFTTETLEGNFSMAVTKKAAFFFTHSF